MRGHGIYEKKKKMPKREREREERETYKWSHELLYALVRSLAHDGKARVYSTIAAAERLVNICKDRIDYHLPN